MEEAQTAQYVELFLLIDARVLFAQALMNARELGGEIGSRISDACPASSASPWRRSSSSSSGTSLRCVWIGGGVAYTIWCSSLTRLPARNGRMPGEQLVHHGAERIQIGMMRELEALHLLGRHVRRTAGDALDARDLRIGDQRDAEVDDAHVGILREHDVRRLDVAMNDAARVGVVQRLGALEHDLDDVVDAQQVVGAAV